MMKIGKNIMATLLAAIISVAPLTFVSNAYSATETGKIVKADNMELMEKFIDTEVPYLLNSVGANSKVEYDLTNIFPIYNEYGNETGRNISFILNNDKIIGDVTMEVTNTGEVSASLGLQEYPDVDKAFNEGKSVGFYCAEEKLILNSSNESKIILASKSERDNTPNIRANSSLNILITKKYSSTPKAVTLNTDYYTSGANFVGQGTNGTCWAACIASKVCKESSSYTSLTADDVYDAVIALGYSNGIGSGRTRYKRGLEAYGMSINNSFTGIKSFSQLKSKTVTDGKMVIFRLQNTAGSGVHAVEFWGYSIIYDYNVYTYLLMDPNYTGARSINVSSSNFNGSTGFSYTSAIGTYDYFDSVC